MDLRKSRFPLSILAIPAAAAVLAGCGGSVGSGGGADAGSGFAFGAAQDEVDAAIADLEPVTLTFQPYAASPESPAAAGAHAFMEAVETRSGGKIEFDVAWGQSIASYPEVDDALADGRLDIAYSVPIYFPAEYPMTDAYNKVSHYSMASPMIGEAISHAMMTEAGWNDPAVIEQYTDKGLVPLNPLVSSGNYWLACNSEGTAPEDWQGRQIRIGGSAQTPVSEAIGASPVSMEYGEAFEALQRGTVDCTFVQGQVAGSTGLMEAAPTARPSPIRGSPAASPPGRSPVRASSSSRSPTSGSSSTPSRSTTSTGRSSTSSRAAPPPWPTPRRPEAISPTSTPRSRRRSRGPRRRTSMR